MAETLATVDMLDTIGSNAGSIPKGTRRVAAYITGSGGVAWSSNQISALQSKGVQFVARIDQTNQVLSLASLRVLVKDIEPGASTNATSIQEAVDRAHLGLKTTLYVMLSDFETLKQMVASASLQAHINYWVADWNLTHAGAVEFLQAHQDVVAVQWASPTSNPHTLVPGSSRTLAEANIDLSVTRADWPTPPAKKKHRVPTPKKVHPKITAAAISGALTTALLAYLNSHGAHLTHLSAQEASVITLASAIIAGYFKSS